MQNAVIYLLRQSDVSLTEYHLVLLSRKICWQLIFYELYFLYLDTLKLSQSIYVIVRDDLQVNFSDWSFIETDHTILSFPNQ